MARVWRTELPIEKLRAAFRYDPETGGLINRYTRGSTARAGEVAGCRAGRYVIVGFEYESYLAHRIVWALHHDTVPDHIDHEDTNGLNNRIGNLRECTPTQNNHNQIAKRAKKDLAKGVTMYSQKGFTYFRSRIVVDKKERSLGYFKTEAEAAAAYESAANEAFGQFART